MSRSKSKTGIAVALLSLALSTPAMAQFGGTGGGGGGFGGTGGGGGFGGTGSGGGLGGGGGSSGTGPTLGGTQGFTGQSLSTGIFTPTQAIFGNRSYGRTPFGNVDNLRGPGAGSTSGGAGGTLARAGSTSRTGQGRTTGLTGAGGLGGLGALGGLGGLGGRNRQMNNLNQNANLQNQVRTRMSSSDLRTEIEVPTIAATTIMTRLSRLPNSEKYQSANVAVQGNVAIINAPTLTSKDADRLGRYLMLEPGIEDYQVVNPQSPAVDNNPLD